MKTIKFYTLGCKANQYDTQGLREHFLRQGYKESENGGLADVYLINTCTVTQKADSDSLNIIRRARRQNPKAKIIVTGCLAELDAAKIRKQGIRGLLINHKKKLKMLQRGISGFKGHTRAFLKVQDGCNNFCSYCKVPLVRGKSSSRPLREVIKEAERLVGSGFKEIVLTGICLGAYGNDLKPKTSLVKVIENLEILEGLLRIRLSSIEAADVSDELIEKIAKSRKLCRHLHIPIQSGDDAILKKMNRKYTRKDYLALIRKLRKLIPEIAISTDVLVGFPGEDELKFQHTQELVKQILPLKVHIFPYSKREGTTAAGFKGEVHQIVVKKRIERLKNIADSLAATYQKQFLNKTFAVLIEGRVKDEPEFWQGHTDNYLQVRVKSAGDLKNALISLKLKKLERDYILADKRYE